MLHAKFQNHRTSGSGEDFLKAFTIYGCGGHLGLDGVSPLVFRCTSTPMETGPIDACVET